LSFGFIRDAGRTQIAAGTCTVLGILLPQNMETMQGLV